MSGDFAVSNRAKFRYRLDQPDGTAITTAGHYNEVPVRDENLAQSFNVVQSDAIRGRRAIESLHHTSRQVEGQINGEIAYGWFDDLMMCALQSAAWSATVSAVTATTISAVASGTLIRNTSTGAFSSFVVGSWVKISGFSTAGNNGYAKVTAVGDHDFGGSETDNELTLAYIALTDESAGQSVTITPSEFIKDGNTQRYITFEREYSDLSSEFARFEECEIGSMDLQLDADAMATIAMAVMGGTETSQTATGASTQNNAPAANTPMSTGNTYSVREGASDTTGNTTITSLSVSVDNQMEQRYSVASQAPNHRRIGRSNVTGNLSLFYDTKAELTKFLAKTQTTLVAILEDAGGKAIIVELPKVEFTEASRAVAGVDSDIMAEMAWQAIYDATAACTIAIHRIAA